MRIIFLAAFILSLSTPVRAQHEHSHGNADRHSAKDVQSSIGTPADPRQAKRSIRVEMNDNMRFTPAQITVARGEVVRFVAANKGQVLHEMVLGTMEDLKQHAEVMKKQPAMAHDEANMVNVAPGKTGEIGWRFTRPGTFYYACLVPGHLDAGMIGKVLVAP